MKTRQILVALIFIFVAAACAPQSVPTTPTVGPQPTQAASPSATTIHATATDSATDLPETTPSPIPTLAILSTLTPASAAGGPGAYHLSPQTADQANENIARMEQKILGLEDEPYPVDRPGWMPSYPPYYQAAWYAAWNALARFPNDPRAESWRWKMAHYMAWSGEGDEASQIYTQLLTSILNTGNVSVEDLPNHVLLGNAQDSFYMPAFFMKTDPISVPNTDRSFMITIGALNHPDAAVAACFLLTKNGEKYSMYFLKHSFSGFSVFMRDSTGCYAKDVTNDGIPEIITDSYSGGHVGSIYIQIYDVSSLPPKILPFYTNQSSSMDVWGGYLEIVGEKPDTTLKTWETFGFCDIYGIRYLGWNGKWLELKKGEINFDNKAHDLFNCGGDIRRFVEELSPPDAISVLSVSLGAFFSSPESQDEPIEEFHVLKGLYTAYAGNQEGARSIFSEIAVSPYVKNSIWSAPAKDFLAAYNTPADLYRACLKLIGYSKYYTQFIGGGDEPPDFVDVDLCNKKIALQYTIATAFSKKPIDEIPDALKKAGVHLLQNGRYDFDGDGQPELWFTVMQPKGKWYEETGAQLWVIAEYAQGLKGMFVANSPETPQLSRDQTDLTKTVTSLNTKQTFELIRHPVSREPFISIKDAEDIDPIHQELTKFLQLRQKLFSNGNPASIYNQLIEIDQKYPNCPFERVNTDGDMSYSYDCDAFYYTLAFSAELAGKETDAVKRYYAVWAAYPESPFATLARLKLGK